MNVTEFAGDAVRPRRIRVMQFGDGVFARAFCDVMIDEYNKNAGGDFGVAIVQTRREGITDTIRAQNGLFTVALRGRENGRGVFRPRVVACVTDALNPLTEWRRFLDFARLDTLRFIVSDADETGDYRSGCDGFEDAPQATFSGKLTRFLYERFTLGKNGFILFPCEPICRNGGALRRAVLDTAVRWSLGDAFAQWIETKNIFCSTHADRIVAGFPHDEKEALSQRLGYDDALLDIAEPFGRWVIEAPDSVRDEWPLDRCNPVRYVADAEPYRTLTERILGGVCAIMAPAACLAGLHTVSEGMADPDARAFLGHALVDEIIPCAPVARAEAAQYAADACERLENPFARRELASAAVYSAGKWAANVLPTIEAYADQNGAAPPCLTFGLSAMIMLYAGCRRDESGAWYGAAKGESCPLRDSEETLNAFSRFSPDMPPESLAYAALSDQTLWGRDLRAIDALEDMVANQLRDMQILGVRGAMRGTWNEDARRAPCASDG